MSEPKFEVKPGASQGPESTWPEAIAIQVPDDILAKYPGIRLLVDQALLVSEAPNVDAETEAVTVFKENDPPLPRSVIADKLGVTLFRVDRIIEELDLEGEELPAGNRLLVPHFEYEQCLDIEEALANELNSLSLTKDEVCEILSIDNKKFDRVIATLDIAGHSQYGKTGYAAVRYDINQIVEVALFIEGEKSPEKHIYTVGDIARILGVGKLRVRSIFDSLGIAGKEGRNQRGCQGVRYRATDLDAAKEVRDKEKASEDHQYSEYQVCTALHIGPPKLRLITEALELDVERSRGETGHMTTRYTDSQLAMIEESVKRERQTKAHNILLKRGGSLLDISERLDIHPLVLAGLLLERFRPSTVDKDVEDFEKSNLFKTHIPASVVRQLADLQNAKKEAMEKLGQRFSNITPLSYVAAKYGETMSGLKEVASLLAIELRLVRIGKEALVCCNMQDIPKIEQSIGFTESL